MSQIDQMRRSKKLSKIIKKRKMKVGLPPGTPVFVGHRKIVDIKITILDYNEINYREKEFKTVEEYLPFKARPTITWINIDGLHDTSILEKFGEHFNLHPLLLEDVLTFPNI